MAEETKEKDASQRLVIGIDYGTTYTGVAYVCHNGRKQPTINDIQLITNWPGIARNPTDEKVPSEVAYSDQKFEWGNKIRGHNEREAWTKLLLDETHSKDQLRKIQKLFHGDADLTEDEADSAPNGAHPPKLTKKPVDIVTDFLSGVRLHLQSVLEARFGSMLTELRREVVITVPAGWSEKAKNLTYQAVCNAGFNADETKISMITEPEAAAIYILRDLNDGPFMNIKPGDHFVVCDAGGGTVDIITYRVDSLDPLFTIKEAVVGIGAKCGAIFVDRQFKIWLRGKLGREKFLELRSQWNNAGSRMMKDFEGAKISFEGDDEDETMSFVYMPSDIVAKNDPTIGVVDGELRIDPDRMREIFNPCVNQILDLIDEQTAEVTSKKAKVKYILLAGGFGKSRYLFNRMKERYSKSGIEVIKPNHPWTAVVRGAVIERVDPVGNSLLQLRLCRRNLGLSLVERFDEAKHKDIKEGDKIVDSSKEITFVKGCMKWILLMGDPLPSSTPSSSSFELPLTTAEGQSQVYQAKVFTWNFKDPPSRENGEMYEVCKLDVDLTNVAAENVTTKAAADEKSYKIVTCQLEIKSEGSGLEFRVLVGGKEVCKVLGKDL